MIADLRRNDYSLDSDQKLLQETFASFFAKQVPTDRVRKAEPVGYDSALWQELTALGAPSMGIPEAVGGGGATLVDLVLVTEEFGRAIAPAPWIERTVAGRVLAGVATSTREPAGDDHPVPPVTLALRPVNHAPRQLVPAGAISDAVLALDGDSLILLADSDSHPAVPNLGGAPLAWWDLRDERLTRQVLVEGPRAHHKFAEAVNEWKLLTAAAMVGLGEAGLSLGVEFAKTRHTLGVPIGALQGIAFPLADAKILLAGAKNLTRKAAWMREHEPDASMDLIAMAYVYALRAANTATTISTHVHGGLGVSVEADVTLYFRRAKGWSMPAGDPALEIAELGRRLLNEHEVKVRSDYDGLR